MVLFWLTPVSPPKDENSLKLKYISLFCHLLKRLHFGSTEFVVKVGGGNESEKGTLYECSLRGDVEGRATGLVAAQVAEQLVLSSYPAGVFHIEQLFTLHEFLENLGQQGLKFEEKE